MSVEQYIRCNSCQKKLMAVIVAKPDPNMCHKIKCTCPFCGGCSDIIDINGILFHGPITPDLATTPTVIANIVQEDEYTVFEIKKRI